MSAKDGGFDGQVLMSGPPSVIEFTWGASVVGPPPGWEEHGASRS